jgi:hypothetical protein
LLSKFLNKKALRITSLGLFTFLLVWVSPPAYAAQAMAIITCADSNGAQLSRTVGWDNENRYFENRGNIATHYCEGGFAGSFTVFVGVTDTSGGELDPSLLFFAGIPSTPAPSPEVSSSPDSASTEEVERTEDVQRTEDVARSEDVARTEEVERPAEPAPVQPDPIPEPTLEPTPEPSIEPEVNPEPKPEVKPEVKPSPTPSAEPSVEPTLEPVSPVEPIPTPTEEPEEELPVLSIGKLVEDIRNIGSDMSPEVREQAQQVVIASIIVSQIAITAVGRKP